jgi:ribosomal protein S27AE
MADDGSDSDGDRAEADGGDSGRAAPDGRAGQAGPGGAGEREGEREREGAREREDEGDREREGEDAEQETGEADGSTTDPATVFSLLGDDRRLAIIAALDEAPDGEAQSFSDLFDRVDVSDSGQFNYHLSKLVPHFVAKTDGGYRLTAAGLRIARAIAAGLYTDTYEIEPFEVDDECYACGATGLVASYADERMRIRCGACGEQILRVTVPPSVVRGRAPRDALAAFQEWSAMGVEQAWRGLCPDCGGTVTPSIATAEPEYRELAAIARFDCQVCSRSLVTSLGALATYVDAVEQFHDRHGVDLWARNYWEIDQFISDDFVEWLSDSPPRVRVTFVEGGESCHVEFDESLAVARVEIVRSGDEPASS